MREHEIKRKAGEREMNLKKKLMALFLACLLCLLMGMTAFAEQPASDSAQGGEPQGTIHILNLLDGSPGKDVEFRLYWVADLDETLELSWRKPYAGLNLDLRTEDSESFKALPKTLEQCISRDGIKPDMTAKTDADGVCSFEGLDKGMYLVTAPETVNGGYRYTTVPALTILPYLPEDSRTLQYEARLEIKHTPQLIPTEEKVVRHVVKTWEDKGYEAERPKSITVQLMKDGAVFDTVVLNAGNGWRYTWKDLDKNAGWYVLESNTDSRYASATTQDGATFIVTNRYKPPTHPAKPVNTAGKPAVPILPQTGQMWVHVFSLASVGLCCILFGFIFTRIIKDSRRKAAAALTVFGMCLIAFAGGLTMGNVAESKQAGEAAQDALLALQEAADGNMDAIFDNDLPVTPDYELVDDAMMPEIEYNGERYIGQLTIPSQDLTLPVIAAQNQANLKIAPGRYAGSIYNDDCIIAGHNYQSHFGRLGNLKAGDSLSFTDAEGNEFGYEAIKTEILSGEDAEGMSVGDWDLTLFTCTLDGRNRVTIRCGRITQEGENET